MGLWIKSRFRTYRWHYDSYNSGRCLYIHPRNFARCFNFSLEWYSRWLRQCYDRLYSCLAPTKFRGENTYRAATLGDNFQCRDRINGNSIYHRFHRSWMFIWSFRKHFNCGVRYLHWYNLLRSTSWPVIRNHLDLLNIRNPILPIIVEGIQITTALTGSYTFID